MCLAIPGQITELIEGSDLATADVSGVKRKINVGLLERDGVGVGDWVLIHVGFAMSKIDEAEARSSLAFLKTLGEAYTDEMDALRRNGSEEDG